MMDGNGVGVGDGRLALALDVWILLCLFDVGAGRLALGTVCFTLGFLQLVFGFQHLASALGFCRSAFGGRWDFVWVC